MRKDVKIEIQNHFTTLGIDCANDADLARSYFLILLCNYCFGKKKPIRIDVTDPEFLKQLEQSHLPFFIELDHFSEEQRAAAEELIMLFQRENLLKNYRVFFDSFSPFIVNWNEFFKHFPEKFSLGQRLRTLTFLLMQDEKLRKSNEIYSPFRMPIERSDEDEKAFIEEYSAKFKMTPDSFLACAKSIFCSPSLNLPVKTSGRIKNAIDEYRRRSVPFEMLLNDYYKIKTHKFPDGIAYNPWGYLHRVIYKAPVEFGVSTAETLFNTVAFPMKNEPPSDVIRSLFYPKSRSDSPFECSFLLSEFSKIVEHHSKVLVIHPSPDLIIKWNQHSNSIGANTIYAVPTSVIADLYSLEFPDKTFIPFDQIKEQNSIDYILITPRNIPQEMMEPLLHSFAVCRSNAAILGLFPNVLFDDETYDIRKILLKNQFDVERMILVSSQAVSSSPRKKVVMYLKKDAPHKVDSTIQTWYLSCWPKGTYYISKEHFFIPTDEFWDGVYSIKSLLTRVIQRKKRGGDLVKTTTRNAAEEYPFSSEITLLYTIIPNRKKRFAGKAYYRSSRVLESTTTKSKHSTEQIEAGLRDKTEEGVIRRLERIPFDERVYPHILEDIFEKYQEHLEDLSLKTLWFCLIPQLQRSKKYDAELCFSMFCGDKQELSVLISGKAKSEDYVNALGCLLTHESKLEQLQYWVQLDLIFKHAISAGYARFNPISELLSEISSQATEEQREVRNALTKKTFSAEEEQRMLDYITDFADKSKSLLRFEKESIWLAGAIKMFTGMSTREVCALQWKDFIQVPGTNAYQFTVSKYVDQQ